MKVPSVSLIAFLTKHILSDISCNLMLFSNIVHNLMSHHRGITPEEFYQEFESIHPGIDGNGRVGCILYNFLRGSMNIPIKPPEFRKV